MDSTAMRDILTLDLQYERQTVAHLQQEIVTLQDERIQWHQECVELTEQLFARDHALEMTQVQLAYTEAQHLALVQNVVEMQNQVAEMEIEVEVWQNGPAGAAAADRTISRTCRSRRATGSFGLERGQCGWSTTRLSGH
jgi:chromosome segregation ATPase